MFLWWEEEQTKPWKMMVKRRAAEGGYSCLSSGQEGCLGIGCLRLIMVPVHQE
jgi:hypothetical protein